MRIPIEIQAKAIALRVNTLRERYGKEPITGDELSRVPFGIKIIGTISLFLKENGIVKERGWKMARYEAYDLCQGSYMLFRYSFTNPEEPVSHELFYKLFLLFLENGPKESETSQEIRKLIKNSDLEKPWWKNVTAIKEL
jgi:hypothetical protein